MIDKYIPFLLAVGIGLAIGIERERRYSGAQKKAMGVRTFILIALFGALAGFVDSVFISAVIALLASVLIVVGYLRTTPVSDDNEVDLGLTTEFAAGVTFVTGYLTHKEAFLAALIGLMTLIVLLSREKLHDFSLKKIRPEEIQAGVILFILGIGVLPVLPTEPVDPWGILNLNRFVTLLVLIGSVQFLGYIATRLFGASVGFPLAGFISGFVSSTAVFLTMPLRVKENPQLATGAAAAAILATVATFCFLMVVIGAVSMPVLFKIAPPLLVAIGVGLIGAYLLSRSETHAKDFPLPKNPLSLSGTLLLALFLSGFTIAIGLIQHFIGTVGTQVASFVAGLAELHGVSIASASMFANQKMDLLGAQNNILIASFASFLSKLLITWILNRGRYAVWVTLIVSLMLAGFVLTWLFFV